MIGIRLFDVTFAGRVCRRFSNTGIAFSIRLISILDMQLGELSDVELVSRMTAIRRDERRLVARTVLSLIEVEDRRLHLRSACSSLFNFCLRRLKMSEGMAFRRINAARLVRRFPCLLARLTNGALHLSGLVLLRDYLTAENAEEVATAASGLSDAKLRKLIAKRWPRPAVPDRIRAQRSRLEPLSPASYLTQFTMSAETHAKLERARELLRHRLPDGDLASIVDRALDLLIAKLEKERLGKAERPRVAAVASDEPTTGIPRASRREVFARDGEQCTYRNEEGERCPARGFLELDHAQAHARGGSSDAGNLRILCGPHNRLHAEEDFGKVHVARKIASRRRDRGGEDSAMHFGQRKWSGVRAAGP